MRNGFRPSHSELCVPGPRNGPNPGGAAGSWWYARPCPSLRGWRLSADIFWDVRNLRIGPDTSAIDRWGWRNG